MAALTLDLSNLSKDVRERLRKTMSDRHAAKLAVAQFNQLKKRKLYEEAIERHGQNRKIGPLTMVIDPVLENYFSRTCDARELVWNDPDFIKWLKREGPEFFMPDRLQKTKVQIQRP